MKMNGILNAELAHAVASMGHTEIMMVVDAGFPIPRDAWRVDLAIEQDLPTHEQVLRLIAGEMIVEQTFVAEEVPEFNPPLNKLVQESFTTAEHSLAKHEDLLGSFAQAAKVIVRTGAFNPWGNVALVSGIDVPKWFDKPGVTTPESYQARLEAMKKEGN